MASINGTPEADTLSGTADADFLFGNGGRDVLFGGAGFDTADFAGVAGDLNVDLDAGTEDAVTGSELLSIEAVNGGGGGDAIAGDAGANLLDGRGGDDSLSGAGGDDTLVGGLGGNVLDGGAGQDLASYAFALGAALINLADGFAEVDDPAGAVPAARDALRNIERVVGGSGSDTILGDANANALSGAGGADALAGGQGGDTLSGGAGDDSLEGGAGTDTAVFAGRRADFAVAYAAEDSAADGFVVSDARPGGGEGADTVAGVEFFSFADGVVPVSELVDGPPPPDPGGDAVPTVFGTAADDHLWFQPYEAVIDGLGGRDWIDAAAEGRRGSVVSAARPDGTVAVTRAGQTDILVNVEEVRFADGRLTFEAADPAARVSRLYEAALDRLPDQAGLNFWIDALQNGGPLASPASGFLGSPEFQARFGGAVADDAAFVDRLYLNVLGRPGEAEGRAFWVGALGDGAGRADVLAAFSESAENQAGTAELVRNGIWDRAEVAAELARLYDTVFGRKPDAPGLTFWKGAIEGGAASREQAADAFTGSAEFVAQYGGLDNRGFADALYVNTLDRPADRAGLDFWAGQLDAGVPRSAVVLAFSESAEHVDLVAGSVAGENPAEFGVLFA